MSEKELASLKPRTKHGTTLPYNNAFISQGTPLTLSDSDHLAALEHPESRRDMMHSYQDQSNASGHVKVELENWKYGISFQ